MKKDTTLREELNMLNLRKFVYDKEQSIKIEEQNKLNKFVVEKRNRRSKGYPSIETLKQGCINNKTNIEGLESWLLRFVPLPESPLLDDVDKLYVSNYLSEIVKYARV